MRKIGSRLISFILAIFVIAIFSITCYICLELFEIIKVPEQYSLLKFLYSKVKIVSYVQNYVQETVASKENIDNSIVVELEGNTVTTIYLQAEQTYQNSNQHFQYYDQLNAYAKTIYEAFEQEKENLKTGDYTIHFDTKFNDLLQQENGNTILNNSFQVAINAFLFDHPEIFYIDITKIYLLTEVTTRPFSKTYKVSIGPNQEKYLYEEYHNKEDVEVAIAQIEQIKSEIIQNTTGNNYEKIKYIHDYLVDKLEYEKNVNTHQNYTIYGTLMNKRAVCEGYAKTFKYLLDELQIPCFIVCGVATNSSGVSESHAWNYVQLDGKWYAVDTTWDDPIIIGNGWISNDIKYKYFLKGSYTFLKDHVEDGTIIESVSFTYPDLNQTDYE